MQLTIQRCKCGCGEFVPDGRSDKFFINKAHRARYRRYRQHLRRYVIEVSVRLDKMSTYLNDPEMCEAGVLAYKQIKQMIDKHFDDKGIKRVRG
jgi:hypothetical protein